MYYRTNSDTGVIRYRSTRRYYRTYSDTGLSGTGVPVGAIEHIRYRTELVQIRELSDTGIPVGTTGLIRI